MNSHIWTSRLSLPHLLPVYMAALFFLIGPTEAQNINAILQQLEDQIAAAGKADKPANALEPAAKRLALLEKAAGSRHPETLRARLELARVLVRLGRREEALDQVNRLLSDDGDPRGEIYRKEARMDRVRLLRRLGQVSEATQAGNALIDEMSKRNGPDSPEVAEQRLVHGRYLKDLGRREDALEQFRRAEESVRTWDGGEGSNAMRVTLWTEIGGSLFELRLYDEALVWEDKALGLADTGKLPASMSVLDIYMGVAMVQIQAGDPDGAIPILKKAIDLCARGERNSRYGFTIHHVRQELATALLRSGHRKEAWDTLRTFVAGLRAEPDYPSDRQLELISNASRLYAEGGRVVEAQGCLSESIEHWRTASRGFSLAWFNTMSGLMEMLGLRGGMYDESMRVGHELLDVVRKEAGRDPYVEEFALNRLFTAAMNSGSYADAREFGTRVLERRMKRLGPDHTDTIAALNNLATLDMNEGNNRAAREKWLIVAEHWKPTPSGIPSAEYLDVLFFLGFNASDDSDAEPYYRQVVTLGERSPKFTPEQHLRVLLGLAELRARRGDFREANELWAKAEHLKIEPGETLRIGTTIAQLAGDRARAAKLAQESLGHVLRSFRENVAWGSEGQRLGILGASKDLRDSANCYGSIGAESVLAEFLLETRSAVLDSLFLDRRRAARLGADGEEMLQEARDSRRHLAEARLQASGNPESKYLQGVVQNLERRVAEVEQRLATAGVSMGSMESAPGSNLAELASRALDVDECLIEFLRYGNRYGALLVRSGTAPAWIQLGDSAPIDAAVRELRDAVTSHRAEANRRAAGAVTVLHDKLVAPIRAVAGPGAKRWFVTPDGDLHMVPFAALAVGSGRFVCEDLEIVMTSSGRALLGKPSTPAKKEALLVGAVEFSGTPERPGVSSPSSEPIAARSLQGINDLAFSPLPGTKSEIDAVQEILRSAGWTTRALEGTQATNRTVAAAGGGAILHFATHGFLLGSGEGPLPSPDETSPVTNRVKTGLRDPLLSSGIALSGAQTVLNRWHLPGAQLTLGEGIMFAAEAATIDWGSPWLVVLSACDTAGRTLAPIEGLQGFVRAFQMAGANHVLVTLWPIADKETTLIMSDFYREIARGIEPSTALQTAQRSWLSRVAKQRGVVEAIGVAGPFVLYSDRRK